VAKQEKGFALVLPEKTFLSTIFMAMSMTDM
jgi:hypothetical protein